MSTAGRAGSAGRFLAVLPFLFAACSPTAVTTPPGDLYPEMILSRAERQHEVSLKMSRTVEYLKKSDLGGILITSAPGFSWATAGADGNAPLFLRDDGRRFLINPAGGLTLAEVEDLKDMGYEVKQLPWYPDGAEWAEAAGLIRALAGGKPFGSDGAYPGARTVPADIARLRTPLTESELREYRWLGRRVAEAVEGVCREIQPGATSRGIEALLSDALRRHAVSPEQMVVQGDVTVTAIDGTPRRDVTKVARQAVASLRGERWGLRAAVTRIIHFGPLSNDARSRLAAAARINAAYWARTVPGAGTVSILQGAIREYELAGWGKEWLEHSPGGPIGYGNGDWLAGPSPFPTAQSGQAFAWQVTLGDIRIEDTILLAGDRLEVLTETPDWPRVDSKALGRIYRSPGILIR